MRLKLFAFLSLLWPHRPRRRPVIRFLPPAAHRQGACRGCERTDHPADDLRSHPQPAGDRSRPRAAGHAEHQRQFLAARSPISTSTSMPRGSAADGAITRRSGRSRRRSRRATACPPRCFSRSGATRRITAAIPATSISRAASPRSHGKGAAASCSRPSSSTCSRSPISGSTRSTLKGSWAGAFGNPQFLPSIYLRLAQDGDGDGRRDIWNSRADTLASIANYFRDAGWRARAAVGRAGERTVGARLGRAQARR